MENSEQYINALPPDRNVQINNLREVLKVNLPKKGFQEDFQYKMIAYLVPLLFISIAYSKTQNQ